jgi:hypothetical protein
VLIFPIAVSKTDTATTRRPCALLTSTRWKEFDVVADLVRDLETKT